jgi:hypothetical protein
MFAISGEGRGTSNLLDLFEITNLNYWPLNVINSKLSNTVYANLGHLKIK